MEQQGQDHKGNLKLLHGTLFFNGDGKVFDQFLAFNGLLILNSPNTVNECESAWNFVPAPASKVDPAQEKMIESAGI